MSKVTSNITCLLSGAVLCATVFLMMPQPEQTDDQALALALKESRFHQARADELTREVEAFRKQLRHTATLPSSVIVETPPPPKSPEQKEAGSVSDSVTAENHDGNTPTVKAKMWSASTTTARPHPTTKEDIKAQLQESIGLTDFEWEQIDGYIKELEAVQYIVLCEEGESPEQARERLSRMAGSDVPQDRVRLRQQTKLMMTNMTVNNMDKLKQQINETNERIRMLLGETRYETYQKNALPITGISAGGIRFIIGSGPGPVVAKLNE